ncbi:MAG: DUF2231 domain-containing protein [Arachnia sp.]
MDKTHVVNDVVDKLAGTPLAEGFATVMDSGADEIEKHTALHHLLTGESLTGHPLHPALVHLPIGITVAAATLEITDGKHHRSAITLLSGVAVAAAIPTAVTGMADWARGRREKRQRRVGALHALAAEAGTTLASMSLVFRLQHKNTAARWFLFAGASAYGIAGFVGGDLVHGRGLAPRETDPDVAQEQ